jgi:hypothetical protein
MSKSTTNNIPGHLVLRIAAGMFQPTPEEHEKAGAPDPDPIKDGCSRP